MSIGSVASAFIRNGQVFTAPSSVGTSGYVLQTNADGTTSWVAQTGGGGGGLPSIAPFTVLANNTNGTAQPTGVAAFTLGAQGTSNSTDAQIVLSHVINFASAGAQNSHAYSDSNFFKNPNQSYCSYDARNTMGNVGETYPHLASFQAIPTLVAGTITEYDGHWSQIQVSAGATVQWAYHFQAINNTGGGTVQNHYAFSAQAPLGASTNTAFGFANNWVLYSPDQANASVHAGPFMFASGTESALVYAGSISGFGSSLEICQNVIVDLVRGDYFPLVNNTNYCLWEMHNPGTNSGVLYAGPTPASGPITVFPITMRFGWSTFTGSDHWGFAQFGDNGPKMYSTVSNMWQFNGNASTNPAMIFGSSPALITFKAADNSTACAVTVTGTLTVNGHTTFEGVTSTGATGTGNIVYSISSALTGTPTAPTATGGTNTTQIATCAFVQAAAYTLPTATSTILGGVKPDGTSILNTAGAISVTPTSIGLGSVTNNAQTRSAVVPNTAPTAGQVLIGNAGGTAYAPVTMSGDATISSAGALTVTKSGGSAFGGGAFVAAYSLPTASTSILGGVIVDGTSITISGGVISSSGGGGSSAFSALTTSTNTTATMTVGAGASLTFTSTGVVNANQLGGTSIGTPTGTANVVFSASPTLTGTALCSALTASGILTISTAGASTASPVQITGVPFVGTTTTSTPLILVGNGTNGAIWNATASGGTYLGFNSPVGFAGNFIDAHVNGGASVFSVNSAGGLTTASTISAGGNLKTSTNTFIVTGGTGAVAQSGKTTVYNSISTVAWGLPAIYGSGRSTAQTGAVASVATYTVGAADGSFDIGSNVNVTAATTASFTVTCTYTDETNTSRTLTFSFVQNGVAVPIQTITNVTGVGAYAAMKMSIRCKASTAITIATTGTFTSVAYNVEGSITQVA